MSQFFAQEAEAMAGMGELIAIAGRHVKEATQNASHWGGSANHLDPR
jgi:hypothetical protein